MNKKDFALGILCGAMLFSGATAVAAGITAEPTWQNIYVDGAQVSMTAYNIAGNNYVKLRDIGQEVGFNVYWQDGVQIDTDAPYTGVAPVQETEKLPTIEEIRQEMILRINEVRKENGVSELTVNQSLMAAAQEYSSKLYTSHKNLVECKTALACGYPHGFGSNLTVLVGTGMKRIAEKAVTNWVNSPGHLETMVGLKLHMAEPQLQELRQRNDMACAMFNLPVFQAQQKKKKVKSMSGAEYHAAARGESWKFQLMNTIDECMRYARTKEEFITLMEIEGYQVLWKDSRKNITYTIPSGQKCRDDKLHDERYLKEAMEHEFRIRKRLIYGAAERDEQEAAWVTSEFRTAEYTDTRSTGTGADADTDAAAHRDPVRDTGGDGTTGAETESAGEYRWYTSKPAADADTEHRQQSDMAPDGCSDQADGRTAEAGSASGEDGRTGWETERETLLAAQVEIFQNHTSGSGLAGGHSGVDDAGSLGHDLVVLGKELERFDESAPLTPVPMHIDKKRWKKLQKKKIALGHNPKDHEDKQTWQQTM